MPSAFSAPSSPASALWPAKEVAREHAIRHGDYLLKSPEPSNGELCCTGRCPRPMRATSASSDVAFQVCTHTLVPVLGGTGRGFQVGTGSVRSCLQNRRPESLHWPNGRHIFSPPSYPSHTHSLSLFGLSPGIRSQWTKRPAQSGFCSPAFAAGASDYGAAPPYHSLRR